MCYLNDNFLKTKNKICFETDGSIEPNNFLQDVSWHSFHDLEYFSIWDNFSVDAMHDFSKGIGIN